MEADGEVEGDTEEEGLLLGLRLDDGDRDGETDGETDEDVDSMMSVAPVRISRKSVAVDTNMPDAPVATVPPVFPDALNVTVWPHWFDTITHLPISGVPITFTPVSAVPVTTRRPDSFSWPSRVQSA